MTNHPSCHLHYSVTWYRYRYFPHPQRHYGTFLGPLSTDRYSHASTVADPDPGSGTFLTPGSGIRNSSFPDLGSQTHIFCTPLFCCCFSIRDGKKSGSGINISDPQHCTRDLIFWHYCIKNLIKILKKGIIYGKQCCGSRSLWETGSGSASKWKAGSGVVEARNGAVEAHHPWPWRVCNVCQCSRFSMRIRIRLCIWFRVRKLIFLLVCTMLFDLHSSTGT
jgi:hypothetical protein